MQTAQSLNWGRVLAQGVAAGVAGGAVFQLYLYLTTVLPAHGSVLADWQAIAAAAIGPTAFTAIAYAWLGLLVNFIVSIGWAGGYAYFAQSQPIANKRWLLAGSTYGIVVYVFMQILLLGAHAFVFPPTPNAFFNDVIAHVLFFGVPVAYVVARMNGE
ncbi:MAG TPA: hypothetical protein VMF11_08075 [Candidatus Baltobacteraceae bacterium]|nr:hypothetical protein [Candidatus Baltobacteraceae bacterium]